MTSDKLEVPKQSAGDAAHAVAKAGISTIPFVGGPAAELFQWVVQPPLERRREHWMAAVGEKLKELESRGLDLEALSCNEQFVSAVMQASQIALRTHQSEKLEALRNAVLNVATGQAPDDTLQHIFLNLVDALTEQHLRVLKVFQSPTPPPGMSMGGLGHVLEHNIPELRRRQDLYIQLWVDLYARGLVNTERLNVTMSGNGLAAKRTTDLGDAFLHFVASPV